MTDHCAICATEPTPQRTPATYLLTTTGLQDPEHPEYAPLCRYHVLGTVMIRMSVPGAFGRIIIEPRRP